MMHDNALQGFAYHYSAGVADEVERIRKKYLPSNENEDEDVDFDDKAKKLENLRKIDKSAARPALILGLLLGIMGLLVLGAGLSMVMVWGQFLGGLLVGLAGVAMVAFAYPLYNMLLRNRRRALAPEILALAEDLLKGESGYLLTT